MRKVMISAIPWNTGQFDSKPTDECLFGIGLCLLSGTAMGEGKLERRGKVIRGCLKIYEKAKI